MRHPITPSEAVEKTCPLSFHGPQLSPCIGAACAAWRYYVPASAFGPEQVTTQPVDEESGGVCLMMPPSHVLMVAGSPAGGVAIGRG